MEQNAYFCSVREHAAIIAVIVIMIFMLHWDASKVLNYVVFCVNWRMPSEIMSIL